MEEKKRLFEEFPPVTTEEWEAVIEKDLKGADYNKKLVWRTAEGFNVKPYYRAENLADIPWTGQNPNEFPYVRGNKAEGNEWLVRQDITVKDVHEANKIALNAISRGANSIGFKLEYDKAYDTIAISTLLNGIDQKAVEINFYNNKYHLPILEMLSKIPDIKGSLNYDPLTRYLRRGVWYINEGADMELGYIVVKADMPNFQTIGVNGHVFTNAGATIVQEMAFSLAVGAEYLDKLTEKGLTIDEIAPKMRFNLAIGQNYFMELAKLRAYRLLWANIVKAYGGKEENAKMHIHATNAELGMSLYDAYVNMLRTTTGTMSAVLGGVDQPAAHPQGRGPLRQGGRPRRRFLLHREPHREPGRGRLGPVQQDPRRRRLSRSRPQGHDPRPHQGERRQEVQQRGHPPRDHPGHQPVPELHRELEVHAPGLGDGGRRPPRCQRRGGDHRHLPCCPAVREAALRHRRLCPRPQASCGLDVHLRQPRHA